MITKELLEKFYALNKELENLESLNNIKEHRAKCCYFEIVEDYYCHERRIRIPRKYSQRLIDFIGQIADEAEKELEKELSQFNK